MVEIWTRLTNPPGYEVSNTGKVRSIKRNIPCNLSKTGKRETLGKELNPTIVDGYCRVILKNNGIDYRWSVHRLVAATFIPNPENKPFVNHINFNRSDNRVENLEWCTAKENMRHAGNAGRLTPTKEHRMKNSASKIGVKMGPLSKAHKEKLSKSLSGIPITITQKMKTRAKVARVLLHVPSQKIFFGSIEMGKFLNRAPGTISNYLAGKLKEDLGIKILFDPLQKRRKAVIPIDKYITSSPNSHTAPPRAQDNAALNL